MNMQALLKQAQKMQRDLGKADAELKEKVYEGSVGGGAIKAEVKGTMQVIKIDIPDEIYQSESKEDLLDMISHAVNEALQAALKDKETVMNQMTGGVKMPGGF